MRFIIGKNLMKLNKYWRKFSDVSRDAINNGSKQKNFLMKYGRDKGSKLLTELRVPFQQRVQSSAQILDDVLGVSEVTNAQQSVSVKENNFLSARSRVQHLKSELASKQDQLSDTRKALDRTDRADEIYLSIVAEEHSALLEVQKLKRLYEDAEESERQFFVEYSSAVRLSHEKERNRVERSKYWSIIASVSGTVLGFLLSSIVTHYRLKSIKNVTTTSIQEASDRLQLILQDNQQALLNKMGILKAITNNNTNSLSANEATTSVDSMQQTQRLEQLINTLTTIAEHSRDALHNMETISKSLQKVSKQDDLEITLKSDISEFAHNSSESNHDTFTEGDSGSTTHSFNLENFQLAFLVAQFALFLYCAVGKP